jgi:hypothetical protein
LTLLIVTFWFSANDFDKSLILLLISDKRLFTTFFAFLYFSLLSDKTVLNFSKSFKISFNRFSQEIIFVSLF